MKIMFQGDSITDAGRDRSDNHNLSGYSLKLKEILGDKYEYVNYACSGDTSDHMIWRHGYEFKKEKPDILIFLIGINDIWREFGTMSFQAVSIEKYISNCVKTINVSRAINPNVKIIFLEPFLLPGSNDSPEFHKKFKLLIEATKRSIESIADEYIILYEPLMQQYEKGIICSDDGVHPNLVGCEFIAKLLSNESKIIK